MTDKKQKKDDPVRSPVERLWHAALLVLGAVIALNLAISFLQPILPWLIGGLVLVGAAWLALAIARRRRSRW
ncbi:MAG: hypothetical protein ACTHOD_01480 [Motilibacteraceae bacterium]